MDDQLLKVVFPNVHEVVRRAMPWEKLPSHFLRKLRDAGMAYSELGLVWGGDNKIVVLPREVPVCHIEYIKEVLGYKRLQTLIVESETGLICQWSPSLANILQGYVGREDAGYKSPLSFSFWGASPEAYSLIKHCDSLGLPVESPDLPEQSDFSTAVMFDSKSKFREVVSNAGNGLDIMEAHVASSITAVAGILKIHIAKDSPCVVKSEFGVGGYGNVFFSRKLLASGLANCIRRLERAVEFAPYIALGDVVVERLVDCGPAGIDAVCGLAQISPDGSCCINGVVREIRVRDYYQGAQSISGELAEHIARETLGIGRLMASNGYRGFFGIDCLVNKEGRLVLLEINARRCSSHYIFEAGKRLFKDTCYSARHYLDLPVTISKPRPCLAEYAVDVFYSLTQATGQDVYAIPTQVTGLETSSPYIGFMLLARDETSVESTYQRLASDLEENGIVLGEVK